jgi:hypothetical protein
MKPLFPALAGGILAIAALPAVTAEMSAVLGGGHSQITRMEALESGRPTVGLSTDSHKRVLDLCVDTVSDPRIFSQGAATRDAILSHCEGELARAEQYAPADGFIWWVRAALAAERNDVEAIFTALQRSRETAPYELWIALRRERIAQRLEALQSPADRAGHDADLLVLARSRRGVQRLATRYLNDTDFRERITALVETLPVEDQRRFLANVRSAAQ